MARLFSKVASAGVAAALTISGVAVSQAAPQSDVEASPDVVEQPTVATASEEQLQELAEQHPMLAPGHGDPDALRGDFDGDGVEDTAVSGVDASSAAAEGALLCWVEFSLSSKGGEGVRQDVRVDGFTGDFAWAMCPKTTVVDFNGDGTDEVFMYHDDEPGWEPLRGRVSPLTVTPDAITKFPLNSGVPMSTDSTFVYLRLRFGDVNNDGRTDVIAVNGSPSAANRMFHIWLTPESGKPDWQNRLNFDGRFVTVGDVDPTRAGNEIIFHPYDYVENRDGNQQMKCTVEALYVPSGDRRVVAMPPADGLCHRGIKVEPVNAGDTVSGVSVTWLNPDDSDVSAETLAYRADDQGVFRQLTNLPAPEAWDDHVVLTTGKHTMGCIPVERNDPQTFGTTIVITKQAEKGYARVTTKGGTPCVFYEWEHAGGGMDEFEYKLVGPGGESRVANVTIESKGDMPLAPVAHDDTFSVDAADGLMTCLPILENDENARYATVKVVGGPSKGAVRRQSFAEGLTCLVYEMSTPGEATLEYVLENSGRKSERATVTINVTGTPKPPVAADDEQEWPFTAAVPDCIPVLGNDKNVVKGEVAIVQPPLNGVAAYNETRNCMSYDPKSVTVMGDEYTYSVETPGGISEATVTVVRPDTVPTAPVAVADEFTVPFGASQTLCVADNDDATGPVEVAVTRDPETGSVESAPKLGCVWFTAPEGAEPSSTVTFDYTATNAGGTSEPVTATVTLVAPGPEGELLARNDWVELTYGGNEGGCITVLRNDSGVRGGDGAMLPGVRVELVSDPAVGHAAVGDRGCVTYWRAPTAVGDDEFHYRIVTEDGTASNTARLRVTMKGTPPAGETPEFE